MTPHVTNTITQGA
jgi:hypothetical protein